MTTNQIAFNKHLEEKRHNRISEIHEHQDVQSRRTTALAAQSQAATAASRLVEDSRANREKERVNWYNAQETARHNLRLEDLSQYNTDRITGETRYKTDTEARLKEIDQQIERDRLDVERHRAQSQRISSLASDIAARAQSLNASTNVQNLQEVVRHNQQVELETRRSNMNNELIRSLANAENIRHNSVSESQSGRKIGYDYSLGIMQQGSRDVEAQASIVRARAAEKDAATRRGAAFAEGFKDVAQGVNQMTNAATNIYNIIRRVQSNEKQQKEK